MAPSRVVLFSDLSMHELEVLPRDLQLCTDMATGVDSLGKFQWGDLVNLDPQTVGVIVRLERESFQVLSMHGKVVTAKPQALEKRKENRFQVALDSQQNSFQRKDIVKVVDGPHSGREGEVKHLYRNFAFLFTRNLIENGGIFVCKTRHVQMAGSITAKPSSGAGLGFMSPRLSLSSPSPHSSPARGGGSGGGRGRGGPGAQRDRGIIGTTIKITGGAYKGNVGIVKDATETMVRVEMHSTCQTISVDRNHIATAAAPAKSGSFSTHARTPLYGAGSQTPMYTGGNKTPMHGSQTPVHGGSMTPMHGSQTPSYEPGSRTPHYGAMTPTHDGSRTPNRSAWDPTVTNTPARGSGAWEPANTPARASDDGYDPAPSPNFGSEQGYNAYTPSPKTPMSEQGYHSSAPSPAGSGYMTSPINMNYNPSSPYSPMDQSPGFAPQTPGSSYNPVGDWISTGLEVQFADGSEVGRVGRVMTISGGNYTVFIPSKESYVTVPGDLLLPVVPNINDRAKVVFGETRDLTGEVVSIDTREAVFRYDMTSDVNMLPIKHLCKISEYQP